MTILAGICKISESTLNIINISNLLPRSSIFTGILKQISKVFVRNKAQGIHTSGFKKTYLNHNCKLLLIVPELSLLIL